MVKANIETSSGLKISIEGASSDIIEIIEDLQHREKRREERVEHMKLFRKRREEGLSNIEKKERNELAHGETSVTDILRRLLVEGFFDKPKKFREVSHRLRDIGVRSPSSTLHPLLSRLVITDKLTRKKGEDDLWEYVKR